MIFSQFINKWLYSNDGYYSKYKAIGKKGDFYTSVSTSKFFGGTIAKHIISLIESKKLDENSVICEIGAHHGYLMADVIEFIYTLKPELLNSLEFVIIERYDDLQMQQKKYLKECFGDAIKLTHYKDLSELSCDSAFFLANEIFDAFECELLHDGKFASVDDDFKIAFDVEDEKLFGMAKKYNKDKGEIAVGYEEFALGMYNSAEKFEFLSFDYGDKLARNDFSIRIYSDHKVFPFFEENLDYKKLYKNSDITYDVNFSHVKDAFEDVGCTHIETKAQMTVLVDFGILDLLEMLRLNVDEKIYTQELDKVKTLIMPDFLGERFKAIRFTKGMK